jgi:hypothetical protein
MSDIVPLRVVATHDFCCSYLPSPISYGSLPGGEGLRRTVDRLRDEGPTIWADAGDFAAPSALATLSGGEAAQRARYALRRRGWLYGCGRPGRRRWRSRQPRVRGGIEHLRSRASKTGFPLLCANSPEVGLPPTAVIETDVGSIGFVGLTCPDSEAYVSAPPLEDDLAGVVIVQARELRDSGVGWVVVLFHDGVNWRFGKRGCEAQPGRFAERCRQGTRRITWSACWAAGWAGNRRGSGSARQSGKRCDSTPPRRCESTGKGSPPRVSLGSWLG